MAAADSKRPGQSGSVSGAHENQSSVRIVPAVNLMLEHEIVRDLMARAPRALVVEAVRALLDEWRQALLRGEESLPVPLPDLSRDYIVSDVADKLEAMVLKSSTPQLTGVINATGIVLHTNLGRAVLARSAINSVVAVGGSYSNLEFDLEDGARGSRQVHVSSLLAELAGAEAALVVNNNAAAILLAMSSIASGKEVVVSRGQQVEIGGSFRIPDIIGYSGARMVEVGTTNKTHLWDYANGITDDTGALLQVHTSNFRVVGFTEQVSLGELVGLSKERNIPVISDLGSGSLVDLSGFGVMDEPTVEQCVQAGADVVTFSGDKLLGGPQAGLMVGKKHWIQRIAKHPLARAFRIDKLTLAALEATLLLYRSGQHFQEIPTLKALAAGEDELEARAQELLERIRPVAPDWASIEVVDDPNEAGGGSLPGFALPGRAVAITGYGVSPLQLQERFRKSTPPVVGHVQQGRFLLSVRSLLPGEIDVVAQVAASVFGGGVQ